MSLLTKAFPVSSPIHAAASAVAAFPADPAQVFKALENAKLPSLSEADLSTLNKTIESIVYVTNNSLSSSDFALLSLLHPLLSKNEAARATFKNLSRYVNNLQRLDCVQKTGLFPLIPFTQSSGSSLTFELPSSESKDQSKQPSQPPQQKQPAEQKSKEQSQQQSKQPAEQKAKEQSKQAVNDNKEAKDSKKDAKSAKSAGGDDDDKSVQIQRVDIRVGQVMSVKPHPTESRLYCEEINIGDKVIPVVSGLAEVISADQLQGKLVVLIVNVKAGDLKGAMSAGRVLVATSVDGSNKKELVQVPDGVKVGERITFAGANPDIAPDNPLSSKHQSKIFKDLHTSGNKIAQYQKLDFLTSAGPCFVPSIVNGTVA